MSIVASCSAHAPAFVCRHLDIALYLLPSAALALVIRALAVRHPIFFLFTLAGTLCHELAHFVVGFLTHARPAGLTVMPRRVGNGWQLGSVTLHNVRWYNAAPAALAPLLIIALPLAVAWWRTHAGAWHFGWRDLAIAFLLAPQFLSFWPSRIDWRTALRSWPAVIVLGALAWLLFHYRHWLAH